LKDSNMQFYLAKRILAMNYQKTNRKAEAEKLYLEAINGFTQIKEFGEPYTGALMFYSDLLSDLNRSNEAFAYLQKAIDVQRNSNNMKDLTALYYTAALVYKKANKKDMALLYHDSAYYNQLKEFQDVQLKATTDAEVKFGNEILKRDVQIANQKKQKYIFIAGLVSLLAALSGILFYYRQKRKDAKQKLEAHQQSTQAYINGEEKEKIRLSRELHDGIAQELLALHFTLKKNGIPEKDLEDITKIGQDIRNLSHELMPLTLKMLGLVPAIEEVSNKILSTATTTYELNVTGIEERLPQNLEISLYRIFQELAQNIIKHSAATHVSIQIILKNSFVNLIVEDNGKGFDETKKVEGIGLSNLKSRVQMVNGQLNYESSEGEGTTTIVRVPVKV
jgi:signal transduction histidine kinase